MGRPNMASDKPPLDTETELASLLRPFDEAWEIYAEGASLRAENLRMLDERLHRRLLKDSKPRRFREWLFPLVALTVSFFLCDLMARLLIIALKLPQR
jgi:hypothetical protein